jgi:hypothetical protein
LLKGFFIEGNNVIDALVSTEMKRELSLEGYLATACLHKSGPTQKERRHSSDEIESNPYSKVSKVFGKISKTKSSAG